jgi:sulfate permease, SulP family
VLDGVLVGVLASTLVILHLLNHPRVVVLGRDPHTGFWQDAKRQPSVETVPAVLVVRIAGELYFANVQRVRQRLLALVDEADERPSTLLLELGAMPGMDVTAVMTLPKLDRELAARGVTLRLASLTDQPLELLQRSPAHDALAERIHPDLETALLSEERAPKPDAPGTRHRDALDT